jgi:beta-lactamase class C
MIRRDLQHTQALRAMKEPSSRRSRRMWQAGLILSCLMTQALGSAAQTPLRWEAAPPPGARSSRSGYIDRAAVQQRPPLGSDFNVAQFEAMAQQLVANQRVPGLAMAIVHHGRCSVPAGTASPTRARRCRSTAHTVFRLASLSKAFAGTLTGLLVNDGTLRWDTRLTQYDPNFRLADPSAAQKITVADLLSHRVGLSHNAYDRDLEGQRRLRDADPETGLCADGMRAGHLLQATRTSPSA